MSNTFTVRFAIRMPNGELYKRPVQKTVDTTDYSIPSPMRDMMVYLGLSSGETTPHVAATEVAIFDSDAEATKLLDEIREAAAAVGVINWGGCIVKQLCTPFTSGDPSIEFCRQVTEWVWKQQAQS